MFPLENGNEVYNYYISTSKERVLVCMLCRICDTANHPSLHRRYLGTARLCVSEQVKTSVIYFLTLPASMAAYSTRL